MSRFTHDPATLPLIGKDTLAQVRQHNCSMALDDLIDELPSLRRCLQGVIYSLQKADKGETFLVAGENFESAQYYLENARERLDQGWNWVARLLNREFEYFPGSVVFENHKLQVPMAWAHVKRKVQKSKSNHPLIAAARDHSEGAAGEDLSGEYMRLHNCIGAILEYCMGK